MDRWILSFMQSLITYVKDEMASKGGRGGGGGGKGGGGGGQGFSEVLTTLPPHRVPSLHCHA